MAIYNSNVSLQFDHWCTTIWLISNPQNACLAVSAQLQPIFLFLSFVWLLNFTIIQINNCCDGTKTGFVGFAAEAGVKLSHYLLKVPFWIDFGQCNVASYSQNLVTSGKLVIATQSVLLKATVWLKQ